VEAVGPRPFDRAAASLPPYENKRARFLCSSLIPLPPNSGGGVLCAWVYSLFHNLEQMPEHADTPCRIPG
jgi:hypothetical protein